MRIGIEGKALPLGCAKTVILRQCAMTGIVWQTPAAQRDANIAFSIAAVQAWPTSSDRFARRCCKVHGPVEEGARQRARSKPTREARDTGTHCAIDVLR